MSRIIKSTLLATTALFASYCSNNTHFAGDGGHVDQKNQNNGESRPEKIERPILEPTITPTATPKVVLIPGEYRLSASTTKFIPEVDAYILVDDSSSMAQMQATLSKAIEKLVIDLAGYKVNFIVRPFSHANNTSVTLAPTAVPSPSPVPMASISMIKYELPSVASFAINENLDAAEIAIVNDRLIAAIKAAGVAGSNTEVGLCLLVRTLKNMSADKPAAFVILSDENDFSAADNSCLDSYLTYTLTNGTFADCNPAVESCTMTAGLVGFNFARFSYQCKTESDYAKATPDSYSSFTNDLYTCSDGKGLCDNVNNGCNLSQLEWVKKQAPAKGCLDSNEILNCSATIRASSWRSNVFSGGDPCVDLVYSSSGTTAGTLVRTARQHLELHHKYQTTSCAKRFYKPATYTEIKNYDYKYVFGNDTAENNFLVPAAAKLGSNFVFSAIIRDPVADVDANCSPTAYYSNGTRYKNIAAALGTRANVFSICSQNYSPALKIIDTFVRSVTGNSYKFNLEEGSRIEKLVILRNGSEFTPVVGTDVSISSGGLVTFTDGYVKSTDEIILRIERTVIE